jgi:hypothetical protein
MHEYRPLTRSSHELHQGQTSSDINRPGSSLISQGREIQATPDHKNMTTHSTGEFGYSLSPNGELHDWSEIAQHWHTRNATLVERCGRHDAPFVHAEHGNMHNFLFAAELCGVSTLREVLGTRGHIDGPQGRLDAAMVSEGRLDLVEAKFAEFQLNADGLPSSGAHNKCMRHLRDACAQVETYRNKHAMYRPSERRERRVGVVFAAAHLVEESGPEDIRLTRYIDAMHKIPHDFMAWSFPASARKFQYWNRHYPGVVMLARLSNPTSQP